MKYTITYAKTKEELDKLLYFGQEILGGNQEIYDRSVWVTYLQKCPELLIYAESNHEVMGVALSHLEENGNITVGIVATKEEYRKKGIAKSLMLEVEKEAMKQQVHLLALASAETAEEFYAKLGYTRQLLIQSQDFTVEELLTLNPDYHVEFTNVYDGKINQVCLKLEKPDRELQQKYENTFHGCNTTTLCWKMI